jgi:hypothetical protein
VSRLDWLGNIPSLEEIEVMLAEYPGRNKARAREAVGHAERILERAAEVRAERGRDGGEFAKPIEQHIKITYITKFLSVQSLTYMSTVVKVGEDIDRRPDLVGDDDGLVMDAPRWMPHVPCARPTTPSSFESIDYI